MQNISRNNQQCDMKADGFCIQSDSYSTLLTLQRIKAIPNFLLIPINMNYLLFNIFIWLVFAIKCLTLKGFQVHTI